MDITELKKLKQLLEDKNQNIIITSHRNPDGDALGSALAFYEYLAQQGFNVNCVLPNYAPSFLTWLKGYDQIVIYDETPEVAKKLINEASVVFSLDYNIYHRTGNMQTALSNTKAKKVLIDHHLEPWQGFDISISKVDISSTSELLFDVIAFLGGKEQINKTIAEALYVGIVTDTGSFSYSCNYPGTYNKIAYLMEKEVDAEKIHQLLYATFTEDRLRLLGHCLSERLRVLPEHKTAYIFLSREDLERFNYQTGDNEGIVNFALTIKGIEFAAMFTQRNNKVRISFRSKGNFSVNEFARTHYNGGGHKNAAGADSFKNMDETLKEFVELVKNIKI